MTLPDQPAPGISGPTAEPAAASAPDQSNAAEDASAAESSIAAFGASPAPAAGSLAAAPAESSFEPLSTARGGGVLGLSSRQAQLVGVVAAVVAGACGAVLIRNRIRQRKRVSAMERLQNQAYLSASRLITAAF